MKSIFVYGSIILGLSMTFHYTNAFWGWAGPNPVVTVTASPGYSTGNVQGTIAYPLTGTSIQNNQLLLVSYDLTNVPRSGPITYEQARAYDRICIFPVIDEKIVNMRVYGGVEGTLYTYFPPGGGEIAWPSCFNRVQDSDLVSIPIPTLSNGTHTFSAYIIVGAPMLNPNQFGCTSCFASNYLAGGTSGGFGEASYIKLTGEITLRVGPPPPTVLLSASPRYVTSGNTSLLSWGAFNATACYASGDWSGFKQHLPNNIDHNERTGAIYSAKEYTLACVNAEGVWATSTASVGLLADSPDLVGLTPSITSFTTQPSGKARISFSGGVQNIGRSIAEFYSSVLEVDKGNDGSWSGWVNDFYTNTVPNGGETYKTFSPNPPTSEFEPGTHSVRLCADSRRTNVMQPFGFGGQIVETNEANNCSQSLVFTVDAVGVPIFDGVCGTLNGTTTSYLRVNRTGGMCQAGSPSTVDPFNGPWSWTCTGGGGGTNAQCSASLATLEPNCLATTIDNCVLSERNFGLNSGICDVSNGYTSGSCNYTCGTGGSWNITSGFPNTCAIPPPPPPPPPSTTDLTADKRTVDPRDPDVILTWTTPDESLCTLTGPGIVGNAIVSTAPITTGSSTVTVNARSTFILRCPTGTDTVTVEVTPSDFET